MGVNFHALIGDGGKAGAREKFQRLIAQLVRLRYRAVRQIEPNPGDWGIDAFVGRLDEMISVWQAKYFIDGIDDDQKSQIRKSFKTALKAARNEGFQIGLWTLCVPVSMTGKTAKWWDGWKKREARKHGVQIELWDSTEIEGLLLTPDATGLLQAYFPAAGQMQSTTRPVVEPDSETDYDQMLFIKQLRAADINEVSSARRQFFNAELLAREVADKDVPQELDALRTSRAEAHSIWETRFIEKCEEHKGSAKLPGLYPDVMRSLENHHQTAPQMPLRMSLVHRLGTMHLAVDDGDAGWTSAYKELVDQHREQPTSDED